MTRSGSKHPTSGSPLGPIETSARNCSSDVEWSRNQPKDYELHYLRAIFASFFWSCDPDEGCFLLLGGFVIDHQFSVDKEYAGSREGEPSYTCRFWWAQRCLHSGVVRIIRDLGLFVTHEECGTVRHIKNIDGFAVLNSGWFRYTRHIYPVFLSYLQV